MANVLYFSIITIFWLLNLSGTGGDASFAPQANLVYFHMPNIFCKNMLVFWDMKPALPNSKKSLYVAIVQRLS